jgi:hypothetical protein
VPGRREDVQRSDAVAVADEARRGGVGACVAAGARGRPRLAVSKREVAGQQRCFTRSDDHLDIAACGCDQRVEPGDMVGVSVS